MLNERAIVPVSRARHSSWLYRAAAGAWWSWSVLKRSARGGGGGLVRDTDANTNTTPPSIPSFEVRAERSEVVPRPLLTQYRVALRCVRRGYRLEEASHDAAFVGHCGGVTYIFV